MITQVYEKYTAKASKAEQEKDYSLAAVFWNKALKHSSTKKQKRWSSCRRDFCKRSELIDLE